MPSKPWNKFPKFINSDTPDRQTYIICKKTLQYLYLIKSMYKIAWEKNISWINFYLLKVSKIENRKSNTSKFFIRSKDDDRVSYSELNQPTLALLLLKLYMTWIIKRAVLMHDRRFFFFKWQLKNFYGFFYTQKESLAIEY